MNFCCSFQFKRVDHRFENNRKRLHASRDKKTFHLSLFVCNHSLENISCGQLIKLLFSIITIVRLIRDRFRTAFKSVLKTSTIYQHLEAKFKDQLKNEAVNLFAVISTSWWIYAGNAKWPLHFCVPQSYELSVKEDRFHVFFAMCRIYSSLIFNQEKGERNLWASLA